MPFNEATPRISPLPGQQDQSARLAASAEVGQAGGTTPRNGESHQVLCIDDIPVCFVCGERVHDDGYCPCMDVLDGGRPRMNPDTGCWE